MFVCAVGSRAKRSTVPPTEQSGRGRANDDGFSRLDFLQRRDFNVSVGEFTSRVFMKQHQSTPNNYQRMNEDQ